MDTSVSKILKVRISSPDAVIWEGDAISVSSINSQGPFDILPYHTNFITIVENQPIKIHTPVKWEEFTYTNAIIYNRKNTVLIYTNI